jgi:hypothetical protein
MVVSRSYSSAPHGLDLFGVRCETLLLPCGCHGPQQSHEGQRRCRNDALIDGEFKQGRIAWRAVLRSGSPGRNITTNSGWERNATSNSSRRVS